MLTLSVTAKKGGVSVGLDDRNYGVRKRGTVVYKCRILPYCRHRHFIPQRCDGGISAITISQIQVWAGNATSGSALYLVCECISLRSSRSSVSSISTLYLNECVLNLINCMRFIGTGVCAINTIYSSN